MNLCVTADSVLREIWFIALQHKTRSSWPLFSFLWSNLSTVILQMCENIALFILPCLGLAATMSLSFWSKHHRTHHKLFSFLRAGHFFALMVSLPGLISTGFGLEFSLQKGKILHVAMQCLQCFFQHLHVFLGDIKWVYILYPGDWWKSFYDPKSSRKWQKSAVLVQESKNFHQETFRTNNF